MNTRLKAIHLSSIEITLSFLLFLVSLSSLAQSGLQSGTPNWLPYITAQAKYNQNYAVTTNTDTDGDGIIDSNDLDDDNDGILDTDEGNLWSGNQFPTILNTALDFEDNTGYLRTHTNTDVYNMMYYGGGSSSPTANGFSAEYGYPWMTSVWFQKSGQHSAD